MATPNNNHEQVSTAADSKDVSGADENAAVSSTSQADEQTEAAVETYTPPPITRGGPGGCC